ncbi:MAG: Gfo/Idh/MocA family protein, partial [Anaerolineae bacterium]
MSIRWGVLSTARIGRRRVIPAIQKSRNGDVVAVASRDAERARGFADDLGIDRAYGSYADLLADDTIDAIYNPLPNNLHAEWSIAAAEAGIPMLCEKPLALNADEAQRMVDAFEQHGVLFAEAFMYRFHPRTQRVKQLVAEGAVGDVQVIRSAFSFPLDDLNNIRLQKDLGGGALMDIGCYCVNVMRFITGEEPVHVAAQQLLGADSGVDETLTGLLEFPSGCLGHFDCSFRAAFENSYAIRGSEGRIVVERSFVPITDAPTVIHLWQGDDHQTIDIPEAYHYQLMVEDFADALLDDRPPRFAPTDAVANM